MRLAPLPRSKTMHFPVDVRDGAQRRAGEALETQKNTCQMARKIKSQK